MAPAVIDLRTAEDPRDVVHRAVQALAEGKLVAFPTETVYGVAVSALNGKAVDRLFDVKGRREGQPFTLAIKSADDALDYVPRLPVLARRLARRCWPGPITLVLDDKHPDSLVKQLPDHVLRAVAPQGTVGLRVPAHDLMLAVLRLTAGPVALTSANRSGDAESVDADAVVKSLGSEIDLVVDDGRCKFGQPSSVVLVDDKQMTMLRVGVINEKALRRLASLIVLFVCTGNTCRSPMAESLMQRRVSEHLSCPMRELEDRGAMVMSAGIAAMVGGRASTEAAATLSERGLDISNHESQPLGDRLVRFADLILTMTRGHRDAILAQWPDAADRTFLLCHDNKDVGDPIGGPIELYRHCADQIDAQLEKWIKEIDFSTIPGTMGG